MQKFDIEKHRQTTYKANLKRDEGLTEPDTIIKHKNIAYGSHDPYNLMDIYYPTNTTKPLPTIVNVHGGGYLYGDKEIYRFYTMFLATQGFTVVNCNYRLAPEDKYPAPLEDINNVFNFLTQHHAEYMVDMDNLFIMSDSAGAQIAEQYLIFLTNPQYASLFDFKPANIHIKAAVLNCGCYFIGKNNPIEERGYFYFGETPDLTTLSHFPAEEYLTAEFPPAFVMTATDDFLKDRAMPLVELLKDLDVPVTFKEYQHPDGERIGHCFHLDQKSAIAKTCNLDELAFLKEHVK